MATTNHMIISVPFHAVYSRLADNERTDYGTAGEAKEVQRSLALDGWKDQFPAVVVEFKDEKERKEMTAECLAERQATWDSLKMSGDAKKLAVWEKLFTTDGKLMEPQYRRNTGFRRAANYVDAMVLRVDTLAKGPEALPADEGKGIDWTGEPVLTHVPVLVKSFKSDLERIVDQQFENEAPNKGKKEVTEKDKLRITRKIMELGGNSTDVKHLYGSNGQKYWGIFKCHVLWLNLKIYDRCFLVEEHPEYIPIKSVKHAETSSFVARYRNDQKGPNRDTSMLPITEEEVGKYFAGLRDRKSEPAVMGRKGLQDLKENNPTNKLISLFADAAIKDEGSMFVPLKQSEAVLNTAFDLAMSGRNDTALTALQLADKQPEIIHAISDAMKTGVSVQEIVQRINSSWHQPAEHVEKELKKSKKA